MPGADNPYREIHREGLLDARNWADFHADPVPEYDPADDPDLKRRTT
jgi:hypothetical protein